MKNFKKLLKTITLLFIFVLFGYVYGNNNESEYIIEGNNNTLKYKIDILKEITSIKESENIIDTNKISYYDYILLFITINNLECNRYDGFCDNGADIGPFQVNQIHRTLIPIYKKMIKDGDYIGLYTDQVRFTYSRIQRFNNGICKFNGNTETWIRCQMINHNGNNKNGHKYKYAEKGIKLYYNYKKDKKLKEYIENR